MTDPITVLFLALAAATIKRVREQRYEEETRRRALLDRMHETSKAMVEAEWERAK